MRIDWCWTINYSIMKIYVASSWRNIFQQEVVKRLRYAGHEVYDFMNPPGQTGFQWSEIDVNWPNWTTEQYRKALNHPVAIAGFNSDFSAMQWADICVMVLPCGRSANTEAGWMKGAGKKVYVLSPDKEEPELMYKIYDGIFCSVSDLSIELSNKCGDCDSFCECSLGPVPACKDHIACVHFSNEVFSNACNLDNENLIKRCEDWVSKLAKSGGKAWTLQVPVNMNEDPDILICELCKRFKARTNEKNK